MRPRPAWFPWLALAAIAACADPDAPTSATTATDDAALTSGSVTANLVITNDWGTGYTAEVRMVNSGDHAEYMIMSLHSYRAGQSGLELMLTSAL